MSCDNFYPSCGQFLYLTENLMLLILGVEDNYCYKLF